jgi:hypothetical protein
MIITNPVKRIADLVAEDPVHLVPVLDSLIPRRKGKRVTNFGTLSKPELTRILSELQKARLAG